MRMETPSRNSAIIVLRAAPSRPGSALKLMPNSGWSSTSCSHLAQRVAITLPLMMAFGKKPLRQTSYSSLNHWPTQHRLSPEKKRARGMMAS